MTTKNVRATIELFGKKHDIIAYTTAKSFDGKKDFVCAVEYINNFGKAVWERYGINSDTLKIGGKSEK